MLRPYGFVARFLLFDVGVLLCGAVCLASEQAAANSSPDGLIVPAARAVAGTAAGPAKTEHKFPEWSKVIEGCKEIEGALPPVFQSKGRKAVHGDQPKAV